MCRALAYARANARPSEIHSLPRAIVQRFTSNFFVVEMKNFAAENLIILVTLACNQDQIVLASLGDRVMDCFAAVGDLFIGLAGFLYAGFGIGENLVRIFSA